MQFQLSMFYRVHHRLCLMTACVWRKVGWKQLMIIIVQGNTTLMSVQYFYCERILFIIWYIKLCITCLVYSVARNIAEKANRVKWIDSIAYYTHKNKLTVKTTKNAPINHEPFTALYWFYLWKVFLQILLNFRFCMELIGVCACMWCALILKKVNVFYCLQNCL